MIGVFGWRSIFLLNVPIGLAALLFALRFPAIPVTEKIRKLDMWGLFLLTAVLICYVMSITLAESHGFSKSVLLLAAGAVVGIAVFLFLEKNTEFPLLDLSLFRNSVFSASLAVSVLLYTTTTGALVILPFYLQQAKGLSTSVSGIMMMTGAVGCALFTPLSGVAAKRFGDFPVIIFGITAMGIGSLFMSTVGLSTSVVTFSVIWFFFNGCLAFFQTPNNTSIIAHAKPQQRGLASGLLNLSRTIGLTTGAAVIGAVFCTFARTASIGSASPRKIADGIHDTFIVTAGILACALFIGLIALRPGKSPAAENTDELAD
ncbi:MAG: MFS transporter [Clostridium luticellarii]|nr:MFS transporter [Clostridium luticellarii]MCI1995843.1 MFS transporter [Clostridium luticellarii]MCI2040269.1 MFS transporter [Clostridium luticellarii]